MSLKDNVIELIPHHYGFVLVSIFLEQMIKVIFQTS